jgi:tetratricopeptide (TPR) repeat protein
VGPRDVSHRKVTTPLLLGSTDNVIGPSPPAGKKINKIMAHPINSEKGERLPGDEKEGRRLDGEEDGDLVILNPIRARAIYGPDHHYYWWGRALEVRQNDGIVAAVPELETATTLNPRFVEGWCELGFAHTEAGNIDKAIACYEKALGVDSEDWHSLARLNVALAERKQPDDAQRRLEVLRTLERIGALSHDERFDLGFLLIKRREILEAARVLEEYTRERNLDSAAHFNLGLLYENMGRDADAIDAYRISAMTNTVHKAQDRINLLLPRLLALRDKLLAKARQPYLRPGDWYKHYINPFALLNVANPTELRGNPKALQKVKQALLREIDLEQGKVAWMPGLVIDKSTVMAILESLNEEGQWNAHRLVFENPSLCEFLTRGHLAHFLVQNDPPPGARFVVMPHKVETSVLEIVSPRFAHQYDIVLTNAIERGDFEAVECLLDGRRWVQPEDGDRCFEGARRAIERLCEPLRLLADNSEHRKVGLGEVDSTLANGSLGAIVGHLPVEFNETHANFCLWLRNLSVNLFNKEGDAEMAKAILDLSRFSAKKSPALAHQLAEDEKALNEIIEKERQNEVHLTINGADLGITRRGVTYGRTTLAKADIVAVRWGIVYSTITVPSPRGGLVKARTASLRIAFKDSFGTNIDACWSSALTLELDTERWGKLVDATLRYLMADIVANFKRRLKSTSPTRVGNLEVREAGVELEIKSWFSQTKVLCGWDSLVAKLEKGNLVLRDATNSKATASLPLESTDNAVILHMLAGKRED